MPVLTAIRTRHRGSKSREIFVDGDLWRAIPADVASQLGLEVGDEIDASDLEQRIAALEPTSARERALRLLTYRERSVHGLRARLEEDGYSEPVAQELVSDLVRCGLVDDERFAYALARTLTQIRGLGRSRALRELDANGIDDELARRALDEALPEDDELTAARALADSAAARSGATVDKVASRLLRRGYRPAIALEAAREAVRARSEAAEDGPEPSSGE